MPVNLVQSNQVLPQASSQYYGNQVYRASKYLPVDVWKGLVKGKFVNYADYGKWVIDNDLQKHGYPLRPYQTYKEEKMTVDSAFGNPPGTFRKWQREQAYTTKFWEQGNRVNRQRGVDNRAKRLQEVKSSKEQNKINQQALNNPKIVDMSDVCKYLLEKGMIETVYNIRNEQALTLQDSKIIIEALFQHSSNKQTIKI